MLSPLSFALASSEAGGSGAITFMSGSGITMVGSSPGCQRSMLTSGPPSDDVPKNRLAVFTLKPSSCSGDDGSIVPDVDFASAGAAAYYASGGPLSASCNSGSSGAFAADGAAAVFAPNTEPLEVAGSAGIGGLPAGAALSGEGSIGRGTRRSPFRVRSTLGNSEA